MKILFSFFLASTITPSELFYLNGSNQRKEENKIYFKPYYYKKTS